MLISVIPPPEDDDFEEFGRSTERCFADGGILQQRTMNLQPSLAGFKLRAWEIVN